MKRFFERRSALSFWVGVALATTATSSYSQSSGIEEVVVTATKREQTLQEVPVAVSVTDAETIEKAQILDVQDLQSVVPSLRVTQLQSSANTNFVIRGFGNGANNPGIEPSVGVFIDGVYRSRSGAALSDLPNLERVEVLRGPQSTLFGKNASAGVISVVTAKPNYEFGGSAELVVGNFGQTVAKGNITGPVSENAAFSFSAGVNQRDGYFDNLIDGSEINERDRWFTRGQLLIEPNDNVSFRFIADYDETDENCCGAAYLAVGPTGAAIQALGGQFIPDDPFSRSAFLDITPSNQVENGGISMQADIDFDNFSLTSITALRNGSTDYIIDSDFNGAPIIQDNNVSVDLDTFTQELRVSAVGDKLDWMLGVFFFDEEVDFRNEIRFGQLFRPYANLLAGGGVDFIEGALGVPAGTFFANGAGVEETAGQKNQAFSIFGTTDWHLSDRATLTLGFNYTDDEKQTFVRQQNNDVFSTLDFVQIGTGIIFQGLTGLAPTPENFALAPQAIAAAQALSTVPCTAQTGPACNQLLAFQPLQFLPQFVEYPNAVEDGTSDESETTWTARLAFDVNDNVNVYASAATGFKATSWNLSRDSRPFARDFAAIRAAGLVPPNVAPGTRFAGPEEATVFELGLKARTEKGAINIAIFDQEIDGFQSNLFIGTGFNLANAGTQSTKGVEVDASYYPVDALQLTFAATWLDPVYDSFVNARDENGTADLSGQTVPGVHELSVTTSATYTHDFANGMSGFIRGDYLYENNIRVIENVPEALATRQVNVLNASLGLATSNGWTASLWGRNLTDDDYLLSAFPTVTQAGSFSGYPNPPRTYGLSIKKTF